MNSPESARPVSLRWRLLRWACLLFAGLVTLLALLWGIENYRGRHAWEACRKELLAAGEKLDLADFVPAPVPDEQNFAMTPLLAPLFDYLPESQRTATSGRWRDTNAFEHAHFLGRLAGEPKTTGDGRDNRRLLDLAARAAAIDRQAKRTNAAPADRSDAARQILAGLEPGAAELAELRAAAQRPFARFNIRYNDGPATLLPHLAVLKGIANVAQLRTLAELELGRNDAAVVDLALVQRVAEAAKNEPFLISGLVRLAIVQIELQAVWEGLARHRFTESQLAALQTHLAGLNLIADYVYCMRGERALCNDTLAKMRQGTLPSDTFSGLPGDYSASFVTMPAGWFYQNQVTINRIDQKLIAVDAAGRRLNPRRFADDSVWQRDLAGFLPYKVLARLLLPAVNKAVMKFAYGQACVDQAVLACALERHRLALGGYPASLAELAPKFLATLPVDLVNGEPLHYRLVAPDHFQLYSVGWNLKDDGGVPGEFKKAQGSSQHPDTMTGDWVWDNLPVAP